MTEAEKTTTEIVETKEKKQLTPEETSILKKMWWRMHFGGLTFNMTKMQANGFTIIMTPALDEIYKDDLEGRKEALVRHNQFYNSHNVMTGFIAGLTAALEKEKKEKGDVTAATIQSVKVSLMGPTAGIGDSFFYNVLRVIAAGVGIGICATGNILGSILFFAIYAVPQLIARWYLLKAGYVSGQNFVDELFSSGLVDAVTKAASIMGIVVLGSLIPGVPVNMAWTININGASVVILDVLNSIMPKILSVGVTLWFMNLIKKGLKPTRLILYVLLACIGLAAIGIF